MIDYEKSDLEAALKKAFEDTKTIGVDGHNLRNDFLRQQIIYGENEGLIECLGDGGDSQWTVYMYGLTSKGKERFFK